MLKANCSQLELFEAGKSIERRETKACSLFLFQIKNHEKAILMFIALIITAVTSFSLGIEKGKRSLKFENRIMNSVIKDEFIQPMLKKESDFKQQQIKESLENYTIQVASYQTRTHAEKEAKALKKRGFSALVLSKGKYIIVCVGNFNDKEKAQSSLPQLRKSYRDCFIKKL